MGHVTLSDMQFFRNFHLIRSLFEKTEQGSGCCLLVKLKYVKKKKKNGIGSKFNGLGIVRRVKK